MVFWKDESKTESWHPRISKFSGTGGSCNFPGFGGRAPLVIESDRYSLAADSGIMTMMRKRVLSCGLMLCS